MPTRKLYVNLSAADNARVSRNASVARDSADKYHEKAVHHAKKGNRYLNMRPATVGGQLVAAEEKELAMKAAKKRDKFDAQNARDERFVRRAGIKKKKR